MAVTTIRGIHNQTGGPIEIFDRENPSRNGRVPAGDGVVKVSIPVPWCDSPADFEQKVLEFRVPAFRAVVRLYQHGPYVWWSKDAAWGSDLPIPGDNREGGDKILNFGPRGPWLSSI